MATTTIRDSRTGEDTTTTHATFQKATASAYHEFAARRPRWSKNAYADRTEGEPGVLVLTFEHRDFSLVVEARA